MYSGHGRITAIVLREIKLNNLSTWVAGGHLIFENLINGIFLNTDHLDRFASASKKIPVYSG